MDEGRYKAQVNFISRCLKAQRDIAQIESFKGKISWLLLFLLMFCFCFVVFQLKKKLM